MNKILLTLRKRKNNGNKYNRIVGIELKKLRSRVKMTLSEASEGICCSSYLSKMENNIAGVKPAYVSELFERMSYKADLSLIDPEHYEILVSSLVKAFCTNNQNLIKSIDNYTKNCEMAYYLDIVDLIVGTYENDIERVEKSLNEFFTYSDSLEDDHILTISVFIGIYYYSQRKYIDARQIFAELKDFTLSEDLMQLYDYYMFYTKFRLNEKFDLSTEFNCVTNNLIKYNNYGALNKIKNDYIFILSLAGYVNQAMDRYELCSEIHNNTNRAFFELAKGNCEKAKNLLKPVMIKDAWYYTVLIKAYDEMNNRYEAKETLNNLDVEEMDGDLDCIEFLKYMKIKYTKDLVERKVYLREVLLPKAFREGNSLLAEFYTKEICECLNSEAHYKEVVLQISKYKKYIRKINAIIYQ